MPPAAAGTHIFPRGRHLALLWLAVYVPAYAHAYGWLNFLFLCNLGVILTAVGVWRGSARLLSMQALAAPVIGLVWTFDLLSRLVAGRHLVGATEYMWDAQFPLFARLLSCYHSVWPVMTLACVRRTGYDRSAWLWQMLLATAVVALSRGTDPALNINGAWLDPVFHRAWGGALAHVTAVVAGLGVVYGLTHAVLRRTLPQTATRPDARSTRHAAQGAAALS